MVQNLKGTNLFSEKLLKKKKKLEREKGKKIKKHMILAKRPKKKKNEKNILFKATRIRNWNEVDWFWTK